MASSWKPKALVWVAKIKKEGMVEALVRPGIYRVRVGAFTMECAEAELKALPKGAKKKHDLIPRKAAPDYRNPDLRKKMKIDLHGKTVEDSIRELDTAVSKALYEGYGSLEIVHGLGSGRVRAAVHKHLDQLGVAAHYSLDKNNPGVTHVFFST